MSRRHNDDGPALLIVLRIGSGRLTTVVDTAETISVVPGVMTSTSFCYDVAGIPVGKGVGE